jgi:hypothetical protein
MGDENKITLEEYANISIGSPDYYNDIDLITINTSDVYTQEWDDWITTHTGALDLDIGDYSDNHLGANNISLKAAGEEMLRVAKDGFYVRGVKVEADAKEAKAVYEAFKSWMTYAILNGEINN